MLLVMTVEASNDMPLFEKIWHVTSLLDPPCARFANGINALLSNLKSQISSLRSSWWSTKEMSFYWFLIVVTNDQNSCPKSLIIRSTRSWSFIVSPATWRASYFAVMNVRRSTNTRSLSLGFCSCRLSCKMFVLDGAAKMCILLFEEEWNWQQKKWTILG